MSERLETATACPAGASGDASRNAVSGRNARYIYAVAAIGQTPEFNRIGIESNRVYTITYQDICAIVHDCPQEPYQSNEHPVVEAWVKAHHRVIEQAKRCYGAVIPLSFDTIVRPRDGASADQVVEDWLKNERDRLLAILEKVKGKDEYGIQILFDTRILTERIQEASEDVRRTRELANTKSPGIAYMYRQKMEKALRSELDSITAARANEFYYSIKAHADEIVVEKPGKVGRDKVMLLNLSCLVDEAHIAALGDNLEKINGMEGFSVHFSGPWPPYSFVGNVMASGGNKQ